MSGWMVFATILLSLAGLVYLLVTDPKRRRTHDLPKLERRRFLWPARCAALGPGLFLMTIGHWSGFSIWAGAITTFGWVMAAITPKAYRALRSNIQSTLRDAVAKMKELSRHMPRSPIEFLPHRFREWRFKASQLTKAAAKTYALKEVEELKARIEDLEARLNELEKNDVALVFPKADESQKAQAERPSYSAE